jgi:hypothetical protein
MSAKSDKINQLYELSRNEEKCVVCGEEKLGHDNGAAGHEFHATWEIDPAKQREVTWQHEGFIGGYIENIKE